MKKREKKIKEGKRFYPVRHFRIGEDAYQWLLKQKKGTWNFTFSNMKQNYGIAKAKAE